MIAAVKSWLSKFTTAGKLAAELARMADALTNLRAEREAITNEGTPELSGPRLAEIREIEAALVRRIDLARLPILRIKISEARDARDAANLAWGEAKRRQHDIASQFETVMTNIYGNKHDGKVALKMRPESVRVALLSRAEAKERLNETELTLRKLTEELVCAERAVAQAERKSRGQPDPVVNAIANARAHAGMTPTPAAAGETNPLPATNI